VRLNNWKTQLRAEKSINKIYQRDFNAAWRKLSKSMKTIKQLEDKIATHLATIKQGT
jgi:predicted translin family RNA/ssDNA-binding protein